MMRSLIVLVLLFLAGRGFAQMQHDPTDNLSSPNWELIGDIEFKVVNKKDLYPVYSESIKRQNGKPFILEGYIVPLKDGMTQSRFLFSTLPINQCMYCGQNGNPIMIMVQMARPIKFTFRPVSIQGVLKLENRNAAIEPPISLMNASILE